MENRNTRFLEINKTIMDKFLWLESRLPGCNFIPSGNRKHLTPISNQLWKKGLYLPSSYDISKREIVEICSLVKKYSE